MPKFKQNYFKPTFEFNRSIFEGITWPRPNSKGTGEYAVTLEPKGFTCDCAGFVYRGRCKHTLSVNNQIKEAVDGQVPQYRSL